MKYTKTTGPARAYNSSVETEHLIINLQHFLSSLHVQLRVAVQCNQADQAQQVMAIIERVNATLADAIHWYATPTQGELRDARAKGDALNGLQAYESDNPQEPALTGL